VTLALLLDQLPEAAVSGTWIPGTYSQWFHAYCQALATEYSCTLAEAEPGARSETTRWLDWHRDALAAGWTPSQAWINSVRHDFPEWWARRVLHDHPDVVDRIFHAGRSAMSTQKDKWDTK
jgi:hypothetical protein